MSDDDFDEPPSRPAPLLESRASYVSKSLQEENAKDDNSDIPSMVAVPSPVFVIRKQPSVHDVTVEAPHGESLIPPKRPPPRPPAASAASPITSSPEPSSPLIERVPSTGVLLSTQVHRTESATDVLNTPSSPQTEPDKDTVVKEGFLVKKGHRRRNWKARWFILTNNSLTYYLDPSQKVAKGVIDLTNRSDITVQGGKDLALEFKTKDRPNCFKLAIKSKNKDFIIDAQTAPEMQGWVRVIAQVLEGKWDKQ